MTAPTVSVSPVVLRWARERTGLTIGESAAHVGIEPDELARWEGAAVGPISGPPLVVLRNLSAHYGVPLSTFLLDAPPADPPRPVDLRVFAGVPGPVIGPDGRKAINRVAALQSAVADILEQFHAAPSAAEPRIPRADDPEAFAATIRESLGISTETQRKWADERSALREWRRAVEGLGIYIVQLPMPTRELRAFSFGDWPLFICLNQRDFVRARVFSLMHELGHISLGAGALCLPGAGRAAMETAPATEVFCNRFAGAVLVPAEALQSDSIARSISSGELEATGENLDRLARRFHVSWAVVWYRMYHLNLIDRVTFSEKFADWDWYPTPPEGGGGMTTGERVLTTYGNAVVGLLLRGVGEGAVTETDVAQFLDFRPSGIEGVEGEFGRRTQA